MRICFIERVKVLSVLKLQSYCSHSIIAKFCSIIIIDVFNKMIQVNTIITPFVKVKEPTDTANRHLRVYVVIYFTLLELGHLQTVKEQ